MEMDLTASRYSSLRLRVGSRLRRASMDAHFILVRADAPREDDAPTDQQIAFSSENLPFKLIGGGLEWGSRPPGESFLWRSPPSRCISAAPQSRWPGCRRFDPDRHQHRAGIGSHNCAPPSES